MTDQAQEPNTYININHGQSSYLIVEQVTYWDWNSTAKDFAKHTQESWSIIDYIILEDLFKTDITDITDKGELELHLDASDVDNVLQKINTLLHLVSNIEPTEEKHIYTLTSKIGEVKKIAQFLNWDKQTKFSGDDIIHIIKKALEILKIKDVDSEKVSTQIETIMGRISTQQTAISEYPFMRLRLEEWKGIFKEISRKNNTRWESVKRVVGAKADITIRVRLRST